MGNKVTWEWEDILPPRDEHPSSPANSPRFESDWDRGRHTMREECLSALRQAEAEGKACINPPDADEIERIVYKTTVTREHNHISGKEIKPEQQKEIAQAISERLRKGE